MKPGKYLLLILLFVQTIAFGFPGNIQIYFNNPVDTTVATGVHATYLYKSVDDTLIAYISRAKYTLDIAVYNFIQSSSISDIAGAINNAYSRGVRIRWIYNGSSSNSGLSQLNGNIRTLSSPTSPNYGIMHNKFMIINANSTNDSDAFVWTGSCNWDAEQINYDVNNIVIIRDKNLALAYKTEFNEMWGDTGLVPNAANSKFGPDKADNTPHIFSIDGKLIESYFSPSDSTNDHILNVISSANDELFFGVYTFTFRNDADSIKAKILNQGVYCAGIIDQFSQSYSPYSILSPVMGNMLKVYSQSNSIYHNKFVIVDPCDYTSDPVVETGSHNWSVAANTSNDENTLIIHDSTIANIYYQSFRQNFADLGGQINACLSTGLNDVDDNSSIKIFPNPSDGNFELDGISGSETKIFLSDLTGKLITCNFLKENGKYIFSDKSIDGGIYIVSVEGIKKSVHYKIIIQHS